MQSPPATASAMRIFVSHSHEDDAWCRALVNALRASLGHDAAAVWYDEHNLDSGQLLDVIERELRDRSIFIVILSPAALRSSWVRNECKWAFSLLTRDPSRVILPVLAAPVEETAIWLWLQDFKRIEAPGTQPFSREEAIRRTLHALALTPVGEAPTSTTPLRGAAVEDLLTQGRALQAQGQHQAALPFFERATQRDPQSFLVWANLGYTLTLLHRHHEAIQAYERATALDPHNAITWYNWSVSLGEVKRLDEAHRAFDTALALDPTLPVASLSAGVARPVPTPASAVGGEPADEEALTATMLEGMLLTPQRLELLKGLQEMMTSVGVPMSIAQLAVTNQFLTPDQLLAAALVSRELVTPQQIAALGRVKQELEATGRAYDLAALLRMFQILPNEQIDAIRAELHVS